VLCICSRVCNTGAISIMSYIRIDILFDIRDLIISQAFIFRIHEVLLGQKRFIYFPFFILKVFLNSKAVALRSR